MSGHTEASPGQPPVRIGTRRSELAMVQAEGVRSSLLKVAPDRRFEIEGIRTAGDRDKSTALYNLEAKSLWTADLEDKLNSKELDVIVHCLKDMPTKLPDSCEIGAIPIYDDRRDALVVKAGLPYTSLQTLPEGGVVGTSSVRRAAQLKRLYPHLQFANLRGNVETRLARLDKSDSVYACTVMSACGLERVGLGGRINQYLSSKNGGIYHAVGQGVLALEIRKGDAKTLELIRPLADTKTTLACLAERELMRTLEGGCSVPIGVETEWIDEAKFLLQMRAIVVSLDGSQSVQDSMDAVLKSEDDATVLGRELASKLVQAGADAILKEINTDRPSKNGET